MLVGASFLALVLAASAPAMSSLPAPDAAAKALAALPKPLAEEDRVGQGALSARLPVYPGAAEAPANVGDGLLAHGMPMNVRAFFTADDPGPVMDFYFKVFQDLHLPFLRNTDMDMALPYPSLTAFDEINDVELSAIAIPSKAGGTTVLLALSDIRGYGENLARAEAAQYGGLPPYPHGQHPSTLQSRDGDRITATVLFGAADKPSEVAAFYRDALGKAGFKEQADPLKADGKNLFLDFVRGGERWHLGIAASDGPNPTQISATHQDVDPLPPLSEDKP